MKYSEIENILTNGDKEMLENYLLYELTGIIKQTPDWVEVKVSGSSNIIGDVDDYIKPELLSFDMYEVWTLEEPAHVVRIRASYQDTLAVNHPDGRFGKVPIGVKFDARVGQGKQDAELTIIPTVRAVL